MALTPAKPIEPSGEKTKPMNKTHQSGFTLAELLVTIAIIGVVSAIAIPSYTGYTASGYFSDGKEDVYRVMAQQERYFLNNMKYTTTLGDGGIGYQVNADGELTSPGGHYLLTAGNCTALTDVNSCVRVTAVGQNKEAGTTIYLQSNGEKSANIQ